MLLQHVTYVGLVGSVVKSNWMGSEEDRRHIPAYGYAVRFGGSISKWISVHMSDVDSRHSVPNELKFRFNLRKKKKKSNLTLFRKNVDIIQHI